MIASSPNSLPFMRAMQTGGYGVALMVLLYDMSGKKHVLVSAPAGSRHSSEGNYVALPRCLIILGRGRLREYFLRSQGELFTRKGAFHAPASTSEKLVKRLVQNTAQGGILTRQSQLRSCCIQKRCLSRWRMQAGNFSRYKRSG